MHIFWYGRRWSSTDDWLRVSRVEVYPYSFWEAKKNQLKYFRYSFRPCVRLLFFIQFILALFICTHFDIEKCTVRSVVYTVRFTCARAWNVHGWCVLLIFFFIYFLFFFFFIIVLALLRFFFARSTMFSTSLNAIKAMTTRDDFAASVGYLLVWWECFFVVVVGISSCSSCCCCCGCWFRYIFCVKIFFFILFSFLWLCTFHFTLRCVKLRFLSLRLVIFICMGQRVRSVLGSFICFAIAHRMCIRRNEFSVQSVSRLSRAHIRDQCMRFVLLVFSRFFSWFASVRPFIGSIYSLCWSIEFLAFLLIFVSGIRDERAQNAHHQNESNKFKVIFCSFFSLRLLSVLSVDRIASICSSFRSPFGFRTHKHSIRLSLGFAIIIIW